MIYNGYIQGVRKIATNISEHDLGPQKKEKKLYKHRSGYVVSEL